jgi:alcohol dehydrogenase, propanol-preferring
MRAMLLKQKKVPLSPEEITRPEPAPDEVLVEVTACGVCRTDLHVFDGDLPHPKLPLILGHEIVGRVVEVGSQVSKLKTGEMVGVPWLAKTCHVCAYCMAGKENLCDRAIFTGYTRDGGYAEFTCANQEFCFNIPDGYDPVSAAPLLCAGLIGWRSYKMAGQAKQIGIYGFGGAAHILTQIAAAQEKEVYAFTRTGDLEGQRFAMSLGAVWAGDSETQPPVPLEAAIIFAPVGALVINALKAIRKGGVVVCGGIHMSDIPAIPYDLIWGERTIKSVANLTRDDGLQFMDVIRKYGVKTEVHPYKLEEANSALADLRAGKFKGAAVLKIKH